MLISDSIVHLFSFVRVSSIFTLPIYITIAGDDVGSEDARLLKDEQNGSLAR
jgi:hypothetical protein